MNYIEFLELDPSDDSNAQAITVYCVNMLEEIKQGDFNGNHIHKLPGVIDKFTDMVNSLFPNKNQVEPDTVDSFMSTWVNEVENSPSVRRTANLSTFVKLHSEVIKTYNRIIKHLYIGKDFSEFHLLYNPQTSDKSKSIELITEAIQLIEKDSLLNRRQKRQIIDALLKALNVLQSDTPDWTAYFGTIQQAIIILGALGSLVGGAVALKQASEKVAEANHIVTVTSIQNINVSFPTVAMQPIDYQFPKTALPSLPTVSK